MDISIGKIVNIYSAALYMAYKFATHHVLCPNLEKCAIFYL